MDEIKNILGDRKNRIILIIIGILVLSVPLTLQLLRSKQIIKSRAGGGPIDFIGQNVSLRNGTQILRLNQNQEAEVGVVFTSPYGAPATSSGGMQ